MTLVGTAGLFLLAGAEFLAVATIVVYAGAILVTFLFVLMLAQPEGHTTYDRRSWEAPISAFIGAVLVGILTATIAASLKAREPLAASCRGVTERPPRAWRAGVVQPISAGRRSGGRAALCGPGRRSGDRNSRPRGDEAAQRAFPYGRYDRCLLSPCNATCSSAPCCSASGLIGFMSRRNMIVMFLCGRNDAARRFAQPGRLGPLP